MGVCGRVWSRTGLFCQATDGPAEIQEPFRSLSLRRLQAAGVSSFSKFGFREASPRKVASRPSVSSWPLRCRWEPCQHATIPFPPTSHIFVAGPPSPKKVYCHYIGRLSYCWLRLPVGYADDSAPLKRASEMLKVDHDRRRGEREREMRGRGRRKDDR